MAFPHFNSDIDYEGQDLHMLRNSLPVLLDMLITF